MDVLIYLDWKTTGLSLTDIASKHGITPADAQQIIRKMEKRIAEENSNGKIPTSP